MTPTVTAIVTYYRNAAFLDEALASVLAQTRPVDEILLVDDASPPDDAVRPETLPPGVRLITMPVNGGPGAARQRASSEANGDFLAYLDADDIWMPAKIERQLTCLAGHPSAAGSYTGMVRFDQAGNERAFLDKPPLLTGRESTLAGHALPSSLMLRQSALRSIGGWSVSRKTSEDWDLGIRITTLSGPLVFVPDGLVRFRRFNHGNYSNQGLPNTLRLARTIVQYRDLIDAWHGPSAWRGLFDEMIGSHGIAMGGWRGRSIRVLTAAIALGAVRPRAADVSGRSR